MHDATKYIWTGKGANITGSGTQTEMLVADGVVLIQEYQTTGLNCFSIADPKEGLDVNRFCRECLIEKFETEMQDGTNDGGFTARQVFQYMLTDGILVVEGTEFTVAPEDRVVSGPQ